MLKIKFKPKELADALKAVKFSSTVDIAVLDNSIRLEGDVRTKDERVKVIIEGIGKSLVPDPTDYCRVSAKMLKAFAESVTSCTTATLTYDGEALRCVADKTEIDLPAEHTGPFKLSTFDGVGGITMDGALFRHICDNTFYATSTDPFYSQLCGIHFKFDKKKDILIATGCDAYRLSEYIVPPNAGLEVNIASSDEVVDYVLPNLMLKRIIPMLPKRKNMSLVTIKATTNAVQCVVRGYGDPAIYTFEAEGRDMSAVEPINYENFRPDGEYVGSFDVNEMSKILSKVINLQKLLPGKQRGITLELEDGEVYLKINNLVQGITIREKVGIANPMHPIELTGINAKYLAEAIKPHKGEQVGIVFESPVNPLELVPDNPNAHMLILPLKLKEDE